MTENAICRRCQTPLPEGRLEGLCPRCLLEAGLTDETPSTTPGGGFVAPPAHQIAPLLPAFDSIELKGRGGMGAVYRGVDRKLDRPVAIKILPWEVGTDPAFAERFAREARAMVRLGHPHIVTILDFGDVEGLCYVVMEFIEGGNLRDLIAAGPLPPGTAVKMAREIADALHFAHERGIVHRDVKPENLLVDEAGHIRITDFGLAKLLWSEGRPPSLTGTHQAVGTPHYMAPEQLTRPDEIDQRADLFSLGVVLYEMLTGQLPLGRFPLPSAAGEADERIDEIVLRALEPDPDRRYASAHAMLTDLEGLSDPAYIPPPSTAAAAGKKGAARGRTVDSPRPAPPPLPTPPSSEAPATQPRAIEGITPTQPTQERGPFPVMYLFLFGVVFLLSFLTWIEVTVTGQEFLREAADDPAFRDFPSRFHSEMPSMTITASAWKSYLFSIPNWLIVVAMAAVLGFAIWRIFPDAPNLWGGMMAATIYGLTHALLFLVRMLDGPANPHIGLLLTILVLVFTLNLLIREKLKNRARAAPAVRSAPFPRPTRRRPARKPGKKRDSKRPTRKRPQSRK